MLLDLSESWRILEDLRRDTMNLRDTVEVTWVAIWVILIDQGVEDHQPLLVDYANFARDFQVGVLASIILRV